MASGIQIAPGLVSGNGVAASSGGCASASGDFLALLVGLATEAVSVEGRNATQSRALDAGWQDPSAGTASGFHSHTSRKKTSASRNAEDADQQGADLLSIPNLNATVSGPLNPLLLVVPENRADQRTLVPSSLAPTDPQLASGRDAVAQGFQVGPQARTANGSNPDAKLEDIFATGMGASSADRPDTATTQDGAIQRFATASSLRTDDAHSDFAETLQMCELETDGGGLVAGLRLSEADLTHVVARAEVPSVNSEATREPAASGVPAGEMMSSAEGPEVGPILQSNRTAKVVVSRELSVRATATGGLAGTGKSDSRRPAAQATHPVADSESDSRSEVLGLADLHEASASDSSLNNTMREMFSEPNASELQPVTLEQQTTVDPATTISPDFTNVKTHKTKPSDQSLAEQRERSAIPATAQDDAKICSTETHDASGPALNRVDAAPASSPVIAATECKQANSESQQDLPQASGMENASHDVAGQPLQQEGTTGIADDHLVNAARMLESGAQAEMRIGLRTHDNGALELHASITDHQVSVAINSDSSNLHSLMAADLPSLQQGLAEHHLNLTSVSFQSGFSTDTGHPSGSQRQTPGSGASAEPGDTPLVPVIAESEEMSDTLINVHA